MRLSQLYQYLRRFRLHSSWICGNRAVGGHFHHDPFTPIAMLTIQVCNLSDLRVQVELHSSQTLYLLVHTRGPCAGWIVFITSTSPHAQVAQDERGALAPRRLQCLRTT